MLQLALQKPWLLWAAIALLLLIAEMAVPYFACLFMAIAAAITAVSAGLGCNRWFQLAIFALTSLLCLLVIRPKLLRTAAASPGVKSRIEHFVGEKAVVTLGTTHASEIGRVLINGQDWAAQSEEIFSVGETVEVNGSDGIHLIIRKLK